jgi:lysophospholipase L1-like esterase
LEKTAARLPGHTFINRGVTGDTSLNLYRRIDDDVIAEKPDGVFVMCGINDASSIAEAGSRPYYRFVKKIPGGNIGSNGFRENMRAIFSKLAQLHIPVWVALPPVEYRPEFVEALRNLNSITATLSAEQGFKTLDLLTAMTPSFVPARAPLNMEQFRIGMEVMVGLHRYEERRVAGGFSYSFDGVHLVEAGASRMAGLVADFLRANGLR